VTLKAPTHPPGAPLPRAQPANVSNAPPLAAPSSPYHLDQDPDDSAPLQKPAPRNSAGPPPLASGGGGGMRPMTMPLNQMSPPAIGGRPLTPGGLPPLGGGSAVPSPGTPPAAQAKEVEPPAPKGPPPLAPPPLAPPPEPKPEPAPLPKAQPSQPASMPPPGRPTSPPVRVPPKETPAQAGRRLALMTLLDRIGEAVDLGALRTNPIVSDALGQEIERAARDQANAMRDEREAPEGVDLEAVARDAHRELVGLGAFGPLLDDEEVAEIHAVRFDQLFTIRGANGTAFPEPIAFSSEEALARVIARLAQQAGEPWKPGESVIERRLPRAVVVAIAPPAAVNHIVSIRKRRRIETTFEELARSGSASKGMGQFLEACIAARANILVSGNAPLPLLSALATASGANGERVVIVQDVEEIGVGNAQTATLSLGEQGVRAATKLRAGRLVVTQLTGGIAAATVDSMAEGNDGVLAALPAPTLRQGINRLVAQLVLHRPGLSLEAMREVVGEAFDIAVEIGAFPDGRLRVMRIAELGGADQKGVVARDLFVFNADPAGGDGNFSATGVVPRIANDLAARGMKLDAAMFKRSGR
jgi:pilus assembly protein CpaF